MRGFKNLALTYCIYFFILFYFFLHGKIWQQFLPTYWHPFILTAYRVIPDDVINQFIISYID